MLKKIKKYFIFAVCFVELTAMQTSRLGYAITVEPLSHDIEQFIQSFYQLYGLGDQIKNIQFCLSKSDSLIGESEIFEHVITPAKSRYMIALGNIHGKRTIAISPYMQKLIRTNIGQKNQLLHHTTQITFYLLHILGKLNCNNFPNNTEGEEALNKQTNIFTLRQMATDALKYLQHDVKNMGLKSNLPDLIDDEIERRKK